MLPLRRERGFTLLEVLVALTLTGLVMGSLLSLSAGSKRLAVRSDQALLNALETRAAIQQALLDDRYGQFETGLESTRFAVRDTGRLPESLRRSRPMTHLLHSWELLDDESDRSLTGVRWNRLALPE